MTAILIVLSIIAQVSQQIFRKEYNKRKNSGSLFFLLIGVLTTLLYFLVITNKNLNFSIWMLVYVIPFSCSYSIAYIFTMFAIKHGPLSITSLVISCSIAIPVLFGVIMLQEPLDLPLILGITALFFSILFVSEPWKKNGKQLSFKYSMYLFIAFLSNGLCMTIQKVFQVTDKNAHSNEFMIFSLILTFLYVSIFILIKERKYTKALIKSDGIIWPLMCGIGNGIANQFTMILAVILPASFLYPVQSAGTIILTAVASILLYKEKLSTSGKAGFVLGALAIVILNM